MATKRKQVSKSSADQGPITLKEARALVQPTASPSQRRAPRRAQGKGNISSSPSTSPEAMGAQKKRRAIARKEEDKNRIKDYKATMALLKKRGVKGLISAPPTGRRRAPGAPSAATGPLQVFAEGDSWFDYPVPFFGGGVIPRLENRLGVPILNMADAGDEVRFMLGVKQRKELIKRLKDGCPAGGPWDALLFSGGGNDIVDNPMALWIRAYKPNIAAAKLIHQPRYDTALALVSAGYEDLIALRDELSPRTHLVFHGYDYAIPDGRGVCHLGPWLKPTFDLHNYPTTGNIRFEVVKEMLRQFAAKLAALAAQHPQVTVIKTQVTLAPQTSSWHNELHPSKDGFKKIAEIFHTTLKTLFPNRVL